MLAINSQPALSLIGKSILRTCLYHDIFNYPLTFKEIYDRCNVNFITLPKLQTELNSLIENRLLYYHKGFYSIQDDIKLVERRLKGNELARKYLKRARLMTRIIARFPYVRGIMLSGSISKEYMDENSDIDYFIVTEHERVWIARSALYIFMRLLNLLGFNTKKYLCFNFFIDNKNLEIEEKNLFTATEIVTLVPIYCDSIYHAFLKANSWTGLHYPHFPSKSTHDVLSDGRPFFKRIVENLLNNNSGKNLDEYLMRLTTKRWQAKKELYRLNDNDYKIAIKARKHMAKNHTLFHQKRILDAYQEKVKQYEFRYNIIL